MLGFTSGTGEKGPDRLWASFQSQPGARNVGYRNIGTFTTIRSSCSWELRFKSGVSSQIDQVCGFNPLAVGRFQGFEQQLTIGFVRIGRSRHYDGPLNVFCWRYCSGEDGRDLTSIVMYAVSLWEVCVPDAHHAIRFYQSCLILLSKTARCNVLAAIIMSSGKNRKPSQRVTWIWFGDGRHRHCNLRTSGFCEINSNDIEWIVSQNTYQDADCQAPDGSVEQ